MLIGILKNVKLNNFYLINLVVKVVEVVGALEVAGHPVLVVRLQPVVPAHKLGLVLIIFKYFKKIKRPIDISGQTV